MSLESREARFFTIENPSQLEPPRRYRNEFGQMLEHAPYSEREYLGALAGRSMMAIQRANLPPGESTGAFTRIRDREVIVELEEGPALRIAFSTSDDAEQHTMLAWLQEFARTMDVLEPLDRAAAALEALCLETRKP